MLPRNLFRAARQTMAWVAVFLLPIQGLPYAPCPCAAQQASAAATPAPARACCCRTSSCGCCHLRPALIVEDLSTPTRGCCDHRVAAVSAAVLGYSSHCSCRAAPVEGLVQPRVAMSSRDDESVSNNTLSLEVDILAHCQHSSTTVAHLRIPGARSSPLDLCIALHRWTI